MADLYSKRFGKPVWVTHHARESMGRRGVDMATLATLLEQGAIKRTDESHLWIYMDIPGRTDNLICAAAVEQAAVVIKTVMINWELEEEL